jgi:hypothetical protein
VIVAAVKVPNRKGSVAIESVKSLPGS